MMSVGSPRSVSNRVNASNGEVVSTPPKSQITASIIFLCPRECFGERLTRNADGSQSEPRLGDAGRTGYFFADENLASNTRCSGAADLLFGPCHRRRRRALGGRCRPFYRHH